MSDVTVVRQVFRSAFWRAVGGGWAAFVAFNIWDVGRRDWPANGVVALLILGAISVIVYAVGWRPAVIGENAGVEVRNPARTIHLPWNKITDIDATDALRVHVDDTIYRSWAVSRGGAMANAVRGSGRKPTGVPGIEANALSELARRSPADYAAATLVDTWRQVRTRSKGEVRVTWAWPEAIVFLAFVVAVVVAAQAA